MKKSVESCNAGRSEVETIARCLKLRSRGEVSKFWPILGLRRDTIEEIRRQWCEKSDSFYVTLTPTREHTSSQLCVWAKPPDCLDHHNHFVGGEETGLLCEMYGVHNTLLPLVRELLACGMIEWSDQFGNILWCCKTEKK